MHLLWSQCSEFRNLLHLHLLTRSYAAFILAGRVCRQLPHGACRATLLVSNGAHATPGRRGWPKPSASRARGERAYEEHPRRATQPTPTLRVPNGAHATAGRHGWPKPGVARRARPGRPRARPSLSEHARAYLSKFEQHLASLNARGRFSYA